MTNDPSITSVAESSVSPSTRSSYCVVNVAVARVLSLGWHFWLP